MESDTDRDYGCESVFTRFPNELQKMYVLCDLVRHGRSVILGR